MEIIICFSEKERLLWILSLLREEGLVQRVKGEGKPCDRDHKER